MNDSSASRSDLTAPPIAILGVPFDNVTIPETIARVEQMVASRRPHYLLTADVHFLVRAHEDVELRRIMFDAHLVLCHGIPLVWASRLLGNPLPEQVVGADLAPLLIKVAAERNYHFFFLGATPQSTERAVAKLKVKYPALNIVGYYSPPFNKLLETDHAEIERRIEAAKPDLLFVSLGCPRQEKWISLHYRSLGVPLALGVGDSIDVLAGHIARPPVWMQRSGTEWLFHLARAVRRLFRRYIKDLWVFCRAILLQWWQLQSRSAKTLPTRVSYPIQGDETWRSIKLPERLDLEAVRNDVLLLEQVLADGRHCLLEMADVKFIDSTGVGLLIRLQKKIHATGRQLVLLAPSEMVQRALSLMHLQDFFASAPDLASSQTLIAARTKEKSTFGLVSSIGEAAPLKWHGELTAANAEKVWELTQAHIHSLPASQKHLDIDLSALRFIDSTGAGIMLRANKVALSQGVTLSFIRVPPAVGNVLHRSGLAAFLLGAAE